MIVPKQVASDPYPTPRQTPIADFVHMPDNELVGASPRELDERTVVEKGEPALTSDQIAIVVRASVAEAIRLLDRRLASIVETVAELVHFAKVAGANLEPREPRPVSPVALKPEPPPPAAPPPWPAPAPTIHEAPEPPSPSRAALKSDTPAAPPAPAWGVAPAATIPIMTSRAMPSPPAAYDALDLMIDGAIDGGRRRRRMVIAVTTTLVLVFGGLFLSLGLSYSP